MGEGNPVSLKPCGGPPGRTQTAARRHDDSLRTSGSRTPPTTCRPVRRVGRVGLTISGNSFRTDTIEITDSLAVSDLVVSFEIPHPWPPDLNVYLIPPGWSEGIRLLDSRTTDVAETEIRRTIRLPNRSWRISTVGQWVLAVYDGKRYDDGSLLGWSLTINPIWGKRSRLRRWLTPQLASGPPTGRQRRRMPVHTNFAPAPGLRTNAPSRTTFGIRLRCSQPPP